MGILKVSVSVLVADMSKPALPRPFRRFLRSLPWFLAARLIL